MGTKDEVLQQRSAAVRLILGSAGTLIALLIILAAVKPDMAMSVMHHVEAMFGM